MLIIFLLLGLIVGSFLNVVISRLPQAESLWGHSRCPKCRARIRWYDNIPLLSFVLLSARCRDCREKISLLYPVVELATGLIFVLAGFLFFEANYFFSWVETAYWLVIFCVLLVILVYDFQHLQIPMIMVWLGISATAAFYFFQFFHNWLTGAGFSLGDVLPVAGAGLGAFLFFFVLSAGTKEKWMGAGDAYLALLAGLVLGWPLIVWGLVIAFALGALYGIVLIILGLKTLKSQVPFGPFLAGGVVTTVILARLFPWLFFSFF